MKITKNKKIAIIAIVLLIIIICVTICIYISSKQPNYIAIDTESTNLEVEYSTQELEGNWSDYKAKITLSDSKTTIEGTGVTNNENKIIINSAGTYYITGTTSNSSILIQARENDDVQLVLENASITSKNTAPINGVEANKLTITLAENSVNTVTDSSSYTEFTDTQNSETDGTIFTKTDLIINGKGRLIVDSNYLDGIVSKDGLKIINSSLEITSKDDAIRGKDYVSINNANITINSEGDGIKTTNDTDSELGYIVIDGGTISINSGDDGIHADTNIVINNGNINIKDSYEGIESNYIEINGGTISIKASDDGINISGGNDSSSLDGRIGQNSFSQVEDSNKKLVINNGNVSVNADGDGLDSNGAIYINGGNVFVQGPISGGNGALDYTSECAITGGDVIIYGSTGMWQNPSNTSTQYVLTFQISGNSGDEIILKDSSETQITSFETEKIYGALSISNANIEKGETYTLYVNGENIASLTADSIITSNSSINGGGMQMPGGMKQPDMQGRSRRKKIEKYKM